MDAIKINVRHEVITFAYINYQASAGALTTALLCPWNHAPLAARSFTSAFSPNRDGTRSSWAP